MLFYLVIVIVFVAVFNHKYTPYHAHKKLLEKLCPHYLSGNATCNNDTVDRVNNAKGFQTPKLYAGHRGKPRGPCPL